MKITCFGTRSLALALCLSLGAGSAMGRRGHGLRVYGLTCEYLTNPVCVESDRPRLAWKIADGRRTRYGETQTAYEIEVASTPARLEAGEADVWRSGRVVSDQTAQLVVPVEARAEGAANYWRVRVWNNFGEVSAWSETAVWGSAKRHWTARWIGGPRDEALHGYVRYVAAHHGNPDFDANRWRNPPTLPSPLLRKRFEVPARVQRATLYATALGCYELQVNGRRTDCRVRAPEWTDYGDHVQFQAYDVTGLLKEGTNVIGATLADGWALGRLAGVKWMNSFPHRGFYAQDRRLLAELHVEMENGRTLTVATDGSWRVWTEGYVREADHFAGETIDARLMPEGWAGADFDDSRWTAAQVDTTIGVRLTAQRNEPIQPHEVLHAQRIWKTGEGRYMVDFGQNVAGHCLLRVRGERGDTVTLRHGEWINADGSLYTQSLGYAKATDRFVLSGGRDEFEPTVTYHGFQYVEVSGLRHALAKDDILAVAEGSASPLAGRFSCSDEGLNRLFGNILWTQRNNMQSVLTDNPSRDERTGAMGDIQIFAQAGIFNMDLAAFLTKYLYDMKDLGANGQFMSMAPSLKREGLWSGFVGAPGWAEAGFIVPWRLYENYGDTVALRTLYAEMKRHTEATVLENPDLIWRVRHNHNGDWLNANTVAASIDSTFCTTRGGTPDDVFATAFLAYSTRLLARTAGVLGEEADSVRYGALADAVRERFIASFVSADGRVEGDSQGAYALALHCGLVPEGLRERCFARLVKCIEEDYDGRLSTGFITTPMMMELLAQHGRIDLAYRLLMSHRFPSWLYIVDLGATTVWERWDAWTPDAGFQNAGMNSLDHVAFGAVAEWMYRHILGINPDPAAPGYAHFTLCPHPGGGLTWAEGSYQSIRGEIKSAWRMRGGRTVYRFTIPVNTRATIVLPGGTRTELGSGDYTMTEKNNMEY